MKKFQLYICYLVCEIAWGHFVRHKTAMVEDVSIGLAFEKDVAKIVSQRLTRELSKGRKKNSRLYMLLPVPHKPWQDLSIVFVLDLPRTIRGDNSIFLWWIVFQK